MLSPEEFNLHVSIAGFARDQHSASRLKVPVVVELEFDSHGAVQTLRPRDSGYG